ncbi:MAG: hypothetical protein VB835_03065 [Pirellulales bacterium]
MKVILALGVTIAALFAVRAQAADAETLKAELGASPHKIVFESYADSNWDLFVVNADGSGRKNLTNTSGVHELYPQASPDGTKICFLADVGQGRETLRSVYYMNVDGSGRKLVAEKSRQPCWSPDSARIAYLPQEFERFNVTDYVSKGLAIYSLKAGKSTPHPNPKIHHLYTLNWSKNGKYFVSTVHGGMGYGHAILALEADGEGVYDLKIPGCRPCLSADATRITWSSNDHTIRIADLDLESGVPTVANRRTVDHHDKLHLYHPDFSPDGKYIIYSIGPGGRVAANGPGTHTHVAEMVGVRGKWDVFLMRADGEGQPLRLTSDENLSNKEGDWLRGPAPAVGGGR